jgi:hypothetical protein
VALCFARVLVDDAVDSADISAGEHLALGVASVVLSAGGLASGLVFGVESTLFAVPVELDGLVDALGFAEAVVDFAVVGAPVHESQSHFRTLVLTVLDVFLFFADFAAFCNVHCAAWEKTNEAFVLALGSADAGVEVSVGGADEGVVAGDGTFIGADLFFFGLLALAGAFSLRKKSAVENLDESPAHALGSAFVNVSIAIIGANQTGTNVDWALRLASRSRRLGAGSRLAVVMVVVFVASAAWVSVAFAMTATSLDSLFAHSFLIGLSFLWRLLLILDVVVIVVPFARLQEIFRILGVIVIITISTHNLFTLFSAFFSLFLSQRHKTRENKLQGIFIALSATQVSVNIAIIGANALSRKVLWTLLLTISDGVSHVIKVWQIVVVVGDDRVRVHDDRSRPGGFDPKAAGGSKEHCKWYR